MKMTFFLTVLFASLGVAWMKIGQKTSGDSAPESVPTHTVSRGELVVSVTEQGTLESSNNTEIKCRVRGSNTITFVIESGTEVQAGEELIRLDTLVIEEEISERTKFYHLAESQGHSDSLGFQQILEVRTRSSFSTFTYLEIIAYNITPPEAARGRIIPQA